MENGIKLYSKQDVIRILRLDEKNLKNPVDSLRWLIRSGQLKAIKVCGQLLFTEQAVRDYLSLCMNRQGN